MVIKIRCESKYKWFQTIESNGSIVDLQPAWRFAFTYLHSKLATGFTQIIHGFTPVPVKQSRIVKANNQQKRVTWQQQEQIMPVYLQVTI